MFCVQVALEIMALISMRLKCRFYCQLVLQSGVTALQMACAQGCRGIVEHLLAFGANVHLQNNVSLCYSVVTNRH